MRYSNCGNPIFVVGAPRSGTTLMAKVLGRHSRIFMPGETHFFDDVYAHHELIGNLDLPEARIRLAAKLTDHYKRYLEIVDQKRINHIIREYPHVWSNWCEGMRDYKGALSGFMEMQMEMEGKFRWGNNAPRDIFNVDEILSFYPHAKFVVCVRDPRGFLLSYKDKWKITGDDHVERLRKLYHPIISTLLWKSSMRQLSHLKATILPDNWLVVRYEDMVSSPEVTMKHVCEMIGEEFESQMLDVEGSNSSTGQQHKGIFATSVERWRDDLCPTEIAVAQQLATQEMTDFGYVPVNISASILALVILYMETPFFLIDALIANAEMRGPLIPYLTKRVKGLFLR